MENIAKAFMCINHTVHIWAEDFAAERGRDYDAVRAKFGDNNQYYRLALDECLWMAGEAERMAAPAVDDDFEIEF